MSGPSTYVPKSAIGRWFESRLPLGGLVHSSFIAYPVPRNLNYMWTFGAILSFMLVAQIVTSIVLAMHFIPSSTQAFSSVDNIMRNVNYGWLIRYLHTNGASLFFFAGYIHMFRGLYYGSFKPPRELLWIIGVIIYFLMMATAFMGYVLPWGSMSLAGATVITNLTSAIPIIGNTIAHWLWGGFAVGGPTLTRFYSLHYLLPFVIAGVVVRILICSLASFSTRSGVDWARFSTCRRVYSVANTRDSFCTRFSSVNSRRERYWVCTSSMAVPSTHINRSRLMRVITARPRRCVRPRAGWRCANAA